ncbi:MAG: hypothetical protein LLG00_16720 [Planctomycetaceae bacterium]|nr:hypothetical protein [Planctomycetaceae bacterium]
MPTIEEIRYWRGHCDGKRGWFCSVDTGMFRKGPHGKGFGCRKAIAYRRALKDLKRGL